jgi:hypothetical protein
MRELVVADPTVLTTFIGTAAGIVGAGTAIVAGRRDLAKDRESDAVRNVASWRALNEALRKEIDRLNAEMGRLRSDYEKQLDAAHMRISEMENDVSVMRRFLRRPPE